MEHRNVLSEEARNVTAGKFFVFGSPNKILISSSDFLVFCGRAHEPTYALNPLLDH